MSSPAVHNEVNLSANITAGDFTRNLKAEDETFNRFAKYHIEHHKSIGKLSIVQGSNVNLLAGLLLKNIYSSYAPIAQDFEITKSFGYCHRMPSLTCNRPCLTGV